jgi:hypothetical protein
MKRHFTYFKAVLLALLTLPMLCGCSNNDDDLKVIFTGKVWKMSYIFREGNPKAYVNFWYDDRDAEAASVAKQKEAGHYEVEFAGANLDGVFSGSFSGRGVDASFTGNWRADGKNRTMGTSNLNWTSEEKDVLAKQFQKGMTNAYKYSGDANALYIYYKDGEVTNVIALLPKNR